MTNVNSNKRQRRMAREPKPDVAAIKESNSEHAVAAREGGAAAPLKKATKTGMVLSLLSRAEGATLDQMVKATGWLPHTTRAALTGLKKKGHGVVSEKTDGVRTYRLTSDT
jgi:hypothetical protein